MTSIISRMLPCALVALALGCGNTDDRFDTMVPGGKAESRTAQQFASWVGTYKSGDYIYEHDESDCPHALTFAIEDDVLKVTTVSGPASNEDIASFTTGVTQICDSKENDDYRYVPVTVVGVPMNLCNADENLSGRITVDAEGSNTLLRHVVDIFEGEEGPEILTRFTIDGDIIRMTEETIGAEWPPCPPRDFKKVVEQSAQAN